MEEIIQIKNLKKNYRDVEAVKNIDFEVEKGKMFAFLGPNGAGKSTTIDMICTFLKPDCGEIKIDNLVVGKDDSKIREIIGVVFQDGVLDDLLTVEENLRVRGGFYGLSGNKLQETVKNVANITELTEILKRPYGKLSGGQKRRCDIARALLNTPKILFLDEPTTGLDPQTRKMIWETIRTVQKESGMTIFLTTHYMEEAASADYVVVIDDGVITAQGTPNELKNKYSYDVIKISTDNSKELISRLENLDVSFKKTKETINIKLASTKDSIQILNDCEQYIKDFEVLKGNMDDVFIGITGKELRE